MLIQITRPSAVSWWILIALTAAPGCRTSPAANKEKFLKRGEALLTKKDYPRAMLEFRNAAAAVPKDAEPYFRIELVYLESGDLRSAIRAFQKAIELNPQHKEAQLKL